MLSKDINCYLIVIIASYYRQISEDLKIKRLRLAFLARGAEGLGEQHISYNFDFIIRGNYL